MVSEKITKEDLARTEYNLARIIEKYARINLKMEPLDKSSGWDKNKEKHSKVETKSKDLLISDVNKPKVRNT